MIDGQGFQKLDPLRWSRKIARSTLRGYQLCRMTVESKDHGCPACFFAVLDSRADQRLMSDVHTVERADGERRSLERYLDPLETFPDSHVNTLTGLSVPESSRAMAIASSP